MQSAELLEFNFGASIYGGMDSAQIGSNKLPSFSIANQEPLLHGSYSVCSAASQDKLDHHSSFLPCTWRYSLQTSPPDAVHVELRLSFLVEVTSLVRVAEVTGDVASVGVLGDGHAVVDAHRIAAEIAVPMSLPFRCHVPSPSGTCRSTVGCKRFSFGYGRPHQSRR